MPMYDRRLQHGVVVARREFRMSLRRGATDAGGGAVRAAVAVVTVMQVVGVMRMGELVA